MRTGRWFVDIISGLFTLFAAPARLLNPLGSSSKGGSPQIMDHAVSSSTDHNIVGSETLNEHRSVVIHRDPWDPESDLH